MNQMTTAEFLRQLYIKEVFEIIPGHPYMAYMIMGAGIEFLGKILEQSMRQDWNTRRKSKDDFNTAMKLSGLSRYSGISNLYESLRCGLLHAGCPGKGLRLGNILDKENLQGPNYVLNLANFYMAFKSACDEVLENSELQSVLSASFLSIG